ncbi:MAG: chromosomal replication initiator protein DnaA [Bryobacterales bacterium]|nr:chromosomal replication initiator protein DnaA [Bryobacterales bacterium]
MVQVEVEDAAVASGTDLWQRIKSRLAARIPPQAFHNWVADTRMDAHENGNLRVLVPDQVTKDFLEQEYGDVIARAIQELNLPIRRVIYSSRMNGAPAPSYNAERAPNAALEDGSAEMSRSLPEPIFASAVGQLNPRFRFDNFVVGSCNQFAHAAARAVASQPGRSYNPLFIYGGVGMGKTHLMHAIGRELLDSFRGMRVVYTSGERFMNDMVGCLRSNRIAYFHRHYRSADILLLDDVHILAGKERTQEEFFHTFNELYEHQKQIVISSDTTPKNIPGLVERLRSRFEWGLMVDVQAPDLETKMAILDKKAELEGFSLPEDVRIYIATKTKSNVGELEGALVKLIAYSSVTRSAMTLNMAQQVLKYLIPGAERRVTMESVIRAVAEEFKLQPAQLKQKSNARTIAYPRQIAMYLIKELTPASLPEIGRNFAGKHHTTVLHAIRKIDQLRQKDADLNRLVQKVTDSIH